MAAGSADGRNRKVNKTKEAEKKRKIDANRRKGDASGKTASMPEGRGVKHQKFKLNKKRVAKKKINKKRSEQISEKRPSTTKSVL